MALGRLPTVGCRVGEGWWSRERLLFASLAAIWLRGPVAPCRAPVEPTSARDRPIPSTSLQWRGRARDKPTKLTARLREMLDALPMPVWRHRDGGALVDCNGAYAAALGSSREAALAEGRSSFPTGRGGGRQRAPPRPTAHRRRLHVVIGGERRLFEVTEAPGRAGATTIGFAIDRTDRRKRRSGAAPPHQRACRRCSKTFRRGRDLWTGQTAQFLQFGLCRSVGARGGLARGRAHPRRVAGAPARTAPHPRISPISAPSSASAAMFTSLIEPQHELLHLPDGRTLQLTVSPHPLGGLIFVYEDVTDRLALERSYNTLIEVQRETLDNLFEGIAVYRQRRPAQAAQPGLSRDLGTVRSRPRGRAAYRRDRREDPRASR